MTSSFSPDGEFVLPARYGKALRVKAGTLVKIVNPYGTQAIDFWAYNAADTGEYLSTENLRSLNSTIPVNKETKIVSTLRRPLVSIVEDTSAGNHDTLLCACNPSIYKELGCKEHHRSCSENLHEGLDELGVEVAFTPGPVNLFMSVQANADGTLTRLLPSSRPGAYIVLRAEMDVIMVFSNCPQDITTINGPDRTPRDCLIEVTGAAA